MYFKKVPPMGVEIGVDDAKVSLVSDNAREAIAENYSEKLDKSDLIKKENDLKQMMKIIRNYRGIRLMLHKRILLLCLHKCRPNGVNLVVPGQ